MTLKQLRAARRSLIRRAELHYARFAHWIPETWPDFLCIGAPRAATTWLYDRLSRDPQIFLPAMKELHFFDEMRAADPEHSGGLKWHRSFHFDLSDRAHWRWYWLQFQAGKGRTKGEITPAYSLLSAPRVRLIFQAIPDLRIIYILRNPVERAWSSLRKMVWYQKGARNELVRDLDWALQTIRHPEILAGGDYRRVMETWEAVFPRENLLYLIHDDIEQSEQLSLNRVYAFLDLKMPSNSQVVTNRVNAAPPSSIPDDVRTFLEHHYDAQIRYLEARFDRDFGHWQKGAAHQRRECVDVGLPGHGCHS